MKIIGSYIGSHDIGFSLIENNNIKACYSEERFSRIKSCFNIKAFPKKSLENIQKDFNIDILDPNIIFAAAKPINTSLPEVKDIVKYRSIKLYDHQYCHACGAYYTSGFDENTLIISYDGGDHGPDNVEELNSENIVKYDPYFKFSYDSFSSFYIVKNNKLIEIDDRITNGSIANLWYLMCYIFNLLGLKDEGKIMGLAPRGKFDEKIYNQLKFLYENDCIKISVIIKKFYTDKISSLNEMEAFQLKADLSYNLQCLTEDVMLKTLHKLYKKYGPFKNLCLAGGIFANVKLNQKINELLPFENIWIYPAMGDEGLSLGSAIAAAVDYSGFKSKKLDTVFFGKKYSFEEIDTELKNFNIKFKFKELDYDYIANLLSQGKLVGLFNGSAEYGPRALGNRSILADPTKKETHQYVNLKLKRDEIMPFAPIILEDKLEDVCHVYKSKYSSKFMTMCYKVKENWINKIPAVINTYDGTARPQSVNSIDHTYFYNILMAFYNKTGIPVLMNTSFNGHGEPIINSPHEALQHLSEGTIDYLILNEKLYYLNE